MEQGEWLYHVKKVDFLDAMVDMPAWAFWLAMFVMLLGFAVLSEWAKRRPMSRRQSEAWLGLFKQRREESSDLPGRKRQSSPSLRCSLCGGPLQYGSITIAGERYLARHCPKCDEATEEATR
jgi:phage FluMu protein Com